MNTRSPSPSCRPMSCVSSGCFTAIPFGNWLGPWMDCFDDTQGDQSACLNNQPRCPSIAEPNTSSCAARAFRIPSASASHRRVDPSTSVNKNVTTPEGAGTCAECHNEACSPLNITGRPTQQIMGSTNLVRSQSAAVSTTVIPAQLFQRCDMG